MLRFEFATDADPMAPSAGFAAGSVEIVGELGTRHLAGFMLVPTLSLMMDRLVGWLPTKSSGLEVDLIEHAESISLERHRRRLQLSVRGVVIGTATEAEFLEALRMAAHRLERTFVSLLPEGDAARQDFEMALELLRRAS